MQRLEDGVRAGADLMCNLIKATVDRPTTVDAPRGVTGGTFQWHPEAYMNPPTADANKNYTYGSPLGKTRRGLTDAGYREGQPPYMRSGAGMRSIGFEITKRDFAAGTISFRFGVDASARDAAHPYMLFHERGIQYPTHGANARTGPLLRRQWLLPAIKRYRYLMATAIIMRARGLG